MSSRTTQFLTSMAMLALAACARHEAAVPATPATAASNNSYSDLEPGSTLKIVMPLLKSGGFRSDWRAQQVNPNTFEVRADDLIGYTTIQYAITGKDRRVLLDFLGAAAWRGADSSAMDMLVCTPAAASYVQ
jgi:hypothetical protein